MCTSTPTKHHRRAVLFAVAELLVFISVHICINGLQHEEMLFVVPS